MEAAEAARMAVEEGLSVLQTNISQTEAALRQALTRAAATDKLQEALAQKEVEAVAAVARCAAAERRASLAEAAKMEVPDSYIGPTILWPSFVTLMLTSPGPPPHTHQSWALCDPHAHHPCPPM